MAGRASRWRPPGSFSAHSGRSTCFSSFVGAGARLGFSQARMMT